MDLHAPAGYSVNSSMAQLLRGRQQSSWCRGLDGWSAGVSECPSRSKAVFLKVKSCKDDGYWMGVSTAADCADRCAACPGCQEVIWSPFDQSCEIHRTLCNGSHLTDRGYGHCTATIAGALKDAVPVPTPGCFQLRSAPGLVPTMHIPTLVPSHLHEMLTGPRKVATKHLRGKCLILLGDSTMSETATDLAVILGAPVAELAVALQTFRRKNSSGLGAAHVQLGGVDLFFSPSTRNMTVVSRRNDAVVYHRSISAPVLDGNFIGRADSAVCDCGARDRARSDALV